MAAGPAPGGFRPRRFALAALMTVLGVNIWTGAPVFAVWVGSKVQEAQGQLSMLAVFTVVVVLAVVVAVLAIALSATGAYYDRLTGRPQGARQAAPWLRSMRGERPQEIAKEHGLTSLEKIMVGSVVGGVLAFEIWFFFFAGSSLPT
ncbi:MAG: hypothetical protein WD844_07405 [Thermoleophilaceae bacterium]